jgi:predicted amino acid racemase
MSAPRLEIRLDHIRHNAQQLVDRLERLGVGVTAVTKATLGSPEVARSVLAAGVAGLGESRIENIERLRRADISAPITLIRSPMLSQVDRVVAAADTSLNTEPVIIEALSRAGVDQGRIHGVVLMVELGDLREGILPGDLESVARHVIELPGLRLQGVGTNLACQNGIAPDDDKMAQLSALAGALEAALGVELDVVSGGNSANLGWALTGGRIGRINDLRLGESVLLGRDPLDRTVIDGLRTDAFTLVAEVIESKVKPTRPWGEVHQGAFGPVADMNADGPDEGYRAILALGRQDVDPAGLRPPDGVEILGTSSDHLVVATAAPVPVGHEMSFRIDGYGSLLAAMTSPFVSRSFRD